MAPREASATSRIARRLPYLVAVSGAAALVYESLWVRCFGLVFGSQGEAVALVLAVFMGGLALGAVLAARRPSRDPLLSFARVELGIGVAALVSLPLLRALPWASTALATVSGASGALEAAGRAILASLVLLPPTVLLGTTLPLAAAVLEREGADVAAGLGRLYMLTTLGGALGLGFTTLGLLPVLGVRGTLVAAAATSLVIGGIGLRWAGEAPPAAAPAQGGEPAESRVGVRFAWSGAALAAASGAASFGLGVLWTRSLSLVIGDSLYAFDATRLAVLLGLALGALAYTRLRQRIGPPARSLGRLFVAAGIATLAGQWLIGRLPIVWLVLLGLLPVSFLAQQIAAASLCLLVLLPVTAVLGLTFPLLLQLAPIPEGSAQRRSGSLLAASFAGAIAGDLAAQLWLVPRFGIQPSYLPCAGLLLVGGTWLLLAPARGSRVAAVAAAGLAVALSPLVPRWTPWDPLLVSAGVYRYGLDWSQRVPFALSLGSWLREQRTLLFYREGREAVVAVVEPKQLEARFLSVNGRTDAGSGPEDVVTQKLVAHVPLLLHPGPRRVLVIGWGAGATAASAAAYPLDSLECVEIEPATWQAAPFFAELSGRLREDPRFRITFADGRNHLLRSSRRWDVIVSEPSNPWLTGVSSLFTREFYEIALSRLREGGVFGQWFHYSDLEPADVKVGLKTFLSVFPQVSLWLVPPRVTADGARPPSADLLLVGSREPRSLDWPKLERAFGDPRLGAELRSTRVLGDAAALVAGWAMGREEMERWVEDRAAFPAGTPLNTDDYPYIELVAPRRHVVPPSAAVRAAALQYEQLAGAAGDVTGVLAGQPGLAAGGALAAIFLDKLGERYAAAGQTHRAIATFSAAIRNDPRDATAHMRAGQLLFDRGRVAEAETQLAEAVRLDPDRARGWEGLGSILLDRRDYPRAEAAHRALLRLEPANVPAWLRLGAALARQGKWDAARDALLTARSIDPKAPVDAELLTYIGRQARGVDPPR